MVWFFTATFSLRVELLLLCFFSTYFFALPSLNINAFNVLSHRRNWDFSERSSSVISSQVLYLFSFSATLLLRSLYLMESFKSLMSSCTLAISSVLSLLFIFLRFGVGCLLSETSLDLQTIESSCKRVLCNILMFLLPWIAPFEVVRLSNLSLRGLE